MKKIAFTLLAMLISGNSAAEWVRIGGGGDSEIYVDLETFRKNGDKVKLWTMETFKTLTNDGGKHKHLSNKIQRELDCKEELNRILNYTMYFGKKGTGKVVHNEYSPHADWHPVVPGSIGKMILEAGCHTTIGTSQWILLETSDAFAKANPDVSIYIDYSSFEKNEGRVAMWQMVDRRGKDHDLKSESYSVKFHREYDCKEQKVRFNSTLVYSANMGVGKIAQAENIPSPWMKLGDEPTKEIWGLLCARLQDTQ